MRLELGTTQLTCQVRPPPYCFFIKVKKVVLVIHIHGRNTQNDYRTNHNYERIYNDIDHHAKSYIVQYL